MSLEIDIPVNDELEPTANKIADALLRVASAEEKVHAIADKLGVSYKDAARGVAAYEKEVKDVTAAQKLQTQKTEAAQGKALALKKKANEDFKKQIGWAKEIDKIVMGTAAAMAAAAAAAGALGAAIAISAKSAGDAKAQSTALIGSWTGGKGAEGLAIIDKFAAQIGLRFQDARDKFVEFRQAGLDNKMSMRLIGLRADLIAVGLSAEEADKQIAPVLEAKGATMQAARIAELAKAFNVAGTGATAAAAKTSSFDAAMNKISNAKTKVMEEIWSRIGPAIGTAANHVANFVVALLKSEDGRKAIDGIVHAFTWAASAVDSVVSALEDGKKMLAAQPELQPLAKDFNAFAAEMYGSPFKGFGTWVATRFDQAITAIKDFGTKAIGYAGTIAADMYDAGISIVTGLVDGIKTKIGSAVHVTKDLASSIASSFADALGIQSPSKLFEGYGRNTVEGYEQGERKALPPMMPLEEAATAAPAVPRVTATADAAGASISVVIEQILISAAGGDVTEIATQIRDEIQRVLTAGLMSRGFV